MEFIEEKRGTKAFHLFSHKSFETRGQGGSINIEENNLLHYSPLLLLELRWIFFQVSGFD